MKKSDIHDVAHRVSEAIERAHMRALGNEEIVAPLREAIRELDTIIRAGSGLNPPKSILVEFADGGTRDVRIPGPMLELVSSRNAINVIDAIRAAVKAGPVPLTSKREEEEIGDEDLGAPDRDPNEDAAPQNIARAIFTHAREVRRLRLTVAAVIRSDR